MRFSGPINLSSCHPDSSATSGRSGELQRGDIGRVKASLLVPYLQKIGIDSYPSDMHTIHTTRTALTSIANTITGPNAGKPRPCVIERYGGEGNQSDVYLMGSFERTRNLPKTFDAFAAPVYNKNDKISVKDRYLGRSHIHTCPEWECRGPQWLVTLPVTMVIETGRYGTKTPIQNGKYLSEASMVMLENIATQQERRFRKGNAVEWEKNLRKEYEVIPCPASLCQCAHW